MFRVLSRYTFYSLFKTVSFLYEGTRLKMLPQKRISRESKNWLFFTPGSSVEHVETRKLIWVFRTYSPAYHRNFEVSGSSGSFTVLHQTCQNVYYLENF